MEFPTERNHMQSLQRGVVFDAKICLAVCLTASPWTFVEHCHVRVQDKMTRCYKVLQDGHVLKL